MLTNKMFVTRDVVFQEDLFTFVDKATLESLTNFLSLRTTNHTFVDIYTDLLEVLVFIIKLPNH